MKILPVAFQAGIATALAIVAVYRLATPTPAGERLNSRARIEQISSSAIIPPGMRAVAVPVNEVIGVAGIAFPGMHVDVVIPDTPSSGTWRLEIYTRHLLQNVEVLSAGQDFKKDAEGKRVAVEVVNLLVTPEQAEQLSLASHQTAIQLVMHNPLNRKVPLFPADVPPPPPKKPAILGTPQDVPKPCGLATANQAPATRFIAPSTPVSRDKGFATPCA